MPILTKTATTQDAMPDSHRILAGSFDGSHSAEKKSPYTIQAYLMAVRLYAEYRAAHSMPTVVVLRITNCDQVLVRV